MWSQASKRAEPEPVCAAEKPPPIPFSKHHNEQAGGTYPTWERAEARCLRHANEEGTL